MAGFDVQAARQAGYSDDEILQHLTQSRNFDVDGAVKAGYSKQDIINHLSGTPAPAPSQPTLTNQFPATNIGPAESGPAAYLKRLEGDVRYGGDSTVGGYLLKKLGAKGTDVGAQAGTQEGTLASPVLGAVRATRGLAETATGSPWQGAKDTIGGGLQAASLPLQFAGGPELEAAAASRPAQYITASKANASQAFQDVNQAIGKSKFSSTPEIDKAVHDLYIESKSGSYLPKVARDFIKAAYDPEAPPLTFERARRFASNASKLSADEYGKTKPIMKYLVGQFHGALNDAVQGVADASSVSIPTGGGNMQPVGEVFGNAMREFGDAAQRNKALATFAKALIQYGGPAAATKLATDYAIDRFKK
jgi:hypothetical protein